MQCRNWKTDSVVGRLQAIMWCFLLVYTHLIRILFCSAKYQNHVHCSVTKHCQITWHICTFGRLLICCQDRSYIFSWRTKCDLWPDLVLWFELFWTISGAVKQLIVCVRVKHAHWPRMFSVAQYASNGIIKESNAYISSLLLTILSPSITKTVPFN